MLIGYYDDKHLVQLVNDAFEHYGTANGIYYRLNAVQTETLERSANRLQSARSAKASSGGDIARRRLLMIDVDPRRAANNSATADEKHAASNTAKDIVEYLRAKGWSEPAIIDSGSGWHLMYRVDLPSDDDGIIKGVLHALAEKFSDKYVDVDTTVADASRFARLPGSVNRKGPNTPERPHRVCKIVSIPKCAPLPVSRELLEELCPEPQGADDSNSAHDDQIEDLVAHARAYINKMPPAISGQHGHARTFSVACRLVIDFDLTPDQAWPLMVEFNARCEPPWSEHDLWRKLEQADKSETTKRLPKSLLDGAS